MEKLLKKIYTKNAPEAIGPYSQAILFNELLFSSGQIPVDPATGEVVQGDITAQAEQVMKNVGAVLAEALIERASRSSGRKAGVSFGEAARHLRNRLEGLSRQLAECLQADVWKRRGEALLASSEEIPEGCSEAEIRFWGASGPETIHIPLDPRLTRIENAQACFKLYRKGQSIKERNQAV